jgi:hypothetical protein
VVTFAALLAKPTAVAFRGIHRPTKDTKIKSLSHARSSA